MKIFSNSDSSAPSAKSIRRAKRSSISDKPEVPEMEIRQKLAANVETSNTAKKQTLLKNSQRLGAGFMNEEHSHPVIQAPKSEEDNFEQKDIMLKSDIHLNDPRSPETQEKLKTVLSTGAFNFNAKEREALDKILSSN